MEKNKIIISKFKKEFMPKEFLILELASTTTANKNSLVRPKDNYR
jgi:hypothetical protein